MAEIDHQIVVIVRFSLDITNGFGKLTDGLYSKERMDMRFRLFEGICLPSLLAQTRKDKLTVVILVSKNMPKEYINKLNSIIKGIAFIHLMVTKPSVDFSQNVHYKKFIKKEIRRLCTMKLDDDDAISPVMCEMVSKYVNQCNKLTLISFPNGCYFDINIGTVNQCNFGLIACGLTLVSNPNEPYNVYHKEYATLGHLGMAKIIDETPLMYLISNHNSNHSLRGRWMKPDQPDDDKAKKNFQFVKWSMW